MEFLKKLFGGGGGGSRVTGDPDGMYYFVRVNRYNDLSVQDDGKTLWAHKSVRGVKCRQGVELDLYYDSNRRLINSEVSGGALVTQADYDEWTAKQNAPTP
jgi:DNA-binding beta-propeller fold protein YncE